LPEALRRSNPPQLPEVTEPQLARHYVELSQQNHCIDTGFYPLGSCTMKYNPKVNDRIASLPGFQRLHPLQRPERSQGMLELLYELQTMLGELAGLPAVSLQPAAGAHGELAGLMLMRAWHDERLEQGTIDTIPRKILIPDTAHGTNPASVTMAGFRAVSVKTDAAGGMDLEAVRAECEQGDIAGLMLTNPNTLGLFEQQIVDIAKAVHEAGGLLYYDGANFNAIMGKAKPGDMGFDIVHFNTHKTFSTPHGGGGPGAGPIVVRDILAPYLPVPRIVRRPDGSFDVEESDGRSIGRLKLFHGNVGVLVRAWAYLRIHGERGLVDVSERAVLNANYVRARVAAALPAPYDRTCMHEFVGSAAALKAETGVRAIDVAKRLIDHGFHPPTMYFPLLVDEALMIEPTETETKHTLDAFADAVIAIVDEAHSDPATVQSAPHSTSVRRLDEATAARQPVLRWRPDDLPVEASSVARSRVKVV
jgi:glycine dehydrogenase subunit 2